MAKLRTLGATRAYAAYRMVLARSILLVLEPLVVVAPILEHVGLLAAIVLIRTFRSFAPGLEVTGRFPWARGRPAYSVCTR